MSIKDPMSAFKPNVSNGQFNNSKVRTSGGPNVSIPSTKGKMTKSSTGKSMSFEEGKANKMYTCRYPKRGK